MILVTQIKVENSQGGNMLLKKGLNSILKKYVGSYIYERIIKGEKKQFELGTEIREATVMIVDTQVRPMSFLEDFNPPSLEEMFSEYISKTFESIEANEGIVINFVGDSLISVFGLKNDNHAEKDCVSALDIINKMNESIKAKGLFNFVIGISTGIVSIGNIGTNNRFFFSVMGDNVINSSILSNLNREYNTCILISENTKKRLTEKFVTRTIDTIRVKGSHHAQEIFELVE
jgi:adenylate cyclase